LDQNENGKEREICSEEEEEAFSREGEEEEKCIHK